MAEPETLYEYGRTPEQTEGGLLGLLNFLKGPVADAFTPERREVITPSKTTYQEIDGYAYPSTTPGVYGPPESGLEYMPVVQGAKSAYDFAGKFLSDGEFRRQTGSALTTGIGQMFSDYTRAASQGGETTYDPVAKREVALDPLLPLRLGMTASILAPVKAGSSVVAGMFAGRNAATAKRKDFDRADEMASEGRSREEIWKETGLFRWERDGKPISDWRFEISDEQAKAVFNPRVQTPTGRLRDKQAPVLSDLFQHPEFYKAFPGKIATLGSSSLDALQKDREAIRTKLVELRASNKNPDEYAAEYQKLQEEDADLLKAYILNAPTSDAPGLPASVRSEPPFVGSRAKEGRMERPAAQIPLTTMPSKQWGAAYYSPYLDKIGTKDRPGAPLPKSLQRVRWDEEGKYVQPFSSFQYTKALEEAIDAFRGSGIRLGTSIVDGKTQYELRRWPGTPSQDAVNPEGLPDYLKRQWDQLQNFGKIYYKKDYDPASRFRGSMVHEGQHSIQHRTPGFEGGSNRQEFLKTKVKDPRTGKKLSATEIYMRTLGEAEARLADSRKDLTDKQRAERFPWTKEGGLDRREDDLILREDLETRRRYFTSPPSPEPEVKKAAGGFVDKPLYDDARVGGLI